MSLVVRRLFYVTRAPACSGVGDWVSDIDGSVTLNFHLTLSSIHILIQPEFTWRGDRAKFDQ